MIAADEEFDQLCFEYGIELDDVVSWVHPVTQQQRNSSTTNNWHSHIESKEDSKCIKLDNCGWDSQPHA